MSRRTLQKKTRSHEEASNEILSENWGHIDKGSFLFFGRNNLFPQSAIEFSIFIVQEDLRRPLHLPPTSRFLQFWTKQNLYDGFYLPLKINDIIKTLNILWGQYSLLYNESLTH